MNLLRALFTQNLLMSEVAIVRYVPFRIRRDLSSRSKRHNC